ncbi:MAG: hypothetical protein JWO47_234 [Candidatus Saccharibacteria bacterium]|nr:hypothetical protein [Candidatus Saccharibacteria bacterium]
MDNKNQPIIESDSLETPAEIPDQTGVVSAPQTSTAGTIITQAPLPRSDKPSEDKGVKKLLGKLNLYTFLLILVLFILGGISYYAVLQNRKAVQDGTLTTQKLTQDSLDKLASTDTTVGDAKQTLNVESNAIFAGGVIIHGNVDLAGTLKVGGPLSLPGLTVGGTTSLDKAAVKSLTDSGDASFQGKVTIQNGISVTGGGSFSGTLTAGQISADSLLLGKELQLSSHIVTSGGTPGHTNGSALGGGGTASNNGNDTSGTVTINTGNSAPAGCFITLTFVRAYANIPRVIVSPASSTAGGVAYYVNRTTSGFSICTSADAPDNTSGMAFDYIVVG